MSSPPLFLPGSQKQAVPVVRIIGRKSPGSYLVNLVLEGRGFSCAKERPEHLGFSP
jgi:hypothetical protein